MYNWIPERKETKYAAEKICEEMLYKSFPKLRKYFKPEIQEAP